jgi:hypothetical protein
MKPLRFIVLALVATTCICAAQRFGGRRGWGWGEGWRPEYDTCRTAREIPSHSTGTPTWTNEPGFEDDVFTFARIRRDSGRQISRRAGEWWTDFPDSDLNLSFRLQQVTSMRVDPDGRVLRLTDPDLYNYPWIYMVEPGSLRLREDEVPILRDYLSNGGVLMADDFWGSVQWEVFRSEIERVLPGKTFSQLDITNQLFHCVFDLKGPINRLQTPNAYQGVQSQFDGVTWEEHDGEECINMSVNVIQDEKGRIMVLAVHNCDNGDGWEREGESDYFFHQFSEKRAYPLGINILFYLMTH